MLDDIYDQFLNRLVEATKSLTVAPADDPGCSVGPVIDAESRDRRPEGPIAARTRLLIRKAGGSRRGRNRSHVSNEGPDERSAACHGATFSGLSQAW